MIKAKLAAQVGQLAADRVPFVLATVVRARRPTSVRPGDTAIVLSDGTIDGFVGGQCAESSVRLYSLRALETGQPMLLRLLPGVGKGDQPSDDLDGAIVEHNPCLSGGALEIFLEPQLPPARIVIVGDSPVARALEGLAMAGGYAVESTPGDEVSELAGAAAVVVASHGSDEEGALTAALSAGVPYVALVASNSRGEAVRAALDLPAELAAQLHTPAGVDIGAETPVEIAVSILAELVAVRHRDPAPERAAAKDGPAKAAPNGVHALTATTDGSARVELNGSTAVEAQPAAAGAQPVAEAQPAAADAQPETTEGESEAETAEPESEELDAAEITQRLPVVDPLAALEAASENSSTLPVHPPPIRVAIDPVCGMKVAISESTLHLDVGGERVYFCGTGCRVAYAAPHAPDVARN